jgi:predicted transcriptional regulator
MMIEVKLSKSERKILDYLISHKRPVQPKLLASRFLLHEKTAQISLKKLLDMGLADRNRVGGVFFYRIKR